eukprot:UC4_evm1s866
MQLLIRINPSRTIPLLLCCVFFLVAQTFIRPCLADCDANQRCDAYDDVKYSSGVVDADSCDQDCDRGCDDKCDDSCDDGCDEKCDYAIIASCDSGCDSDCDRECDSGCDDSCDKDCDDCGLSDCRCKSHRENSPVCSKRGPCSSGKYGPYSGSCKSCPSGKCPMGKEDLAGATVILYLARRAPEESTSQKETTSPVVSPVSH